MKDKNMTWIMLCVLIAADGAAWFQIFAAAPPRSASISFLDVGQGDSSLLILAGGVKVMTDAGPDSSVAKSLERALPQSDRSIDLAVITHPELDHFNGFNYLLENYRVGAFIVNGRDHPDMEQWSRLLKKIAAKNIPFITLGAGDGIHYKNNRIDILSPNEQLASGSESNDAGLVQKVYTPDFTVLLTADTGFSVENYLRARYGAATLSADILKIGHHGSKYSSGAAFLDAVRPTLAAIGVGARNTYGHPTKETLARLAAARVVVFRTDQNGTITARRVDGKLKVFAEKQSR